MGQWFSWMSPNNETHDAAAAHADAERKAQAAAKEEEACQRRLKAIKEKIEAEEKELQLERLRKKAKQADELEERFRIQEQELRKREEQMQKYMDILTEHKADLEAAQHRQAELVMAVQVLSAGFSPIVWPTTQEIERAECRLAPREGFIHIAIAGGSGTGKSSLINAFRGIKNSDQSGIAAAVGVIETTMGIGRYPDTSEDEARKHLVWYDIPGSGTLLKPGPQYFNEHGLFIFDLIIIAFGDRFTEQDFAILENSARFKTPTMIIRSKSNQHIENIITEQLDYEGPHNGSEFERAYEKARDQYIHDSRQTVRNNLAQGHYHNPNQRVYLVSAPGLRACVRGVPESSLAPTSCWIDEGILVQDIAKTVVERRFNLKEVAKSFGKRRAEQVKEAIARAKVMFGGSWSLKDLLGDEESGINGDDERADSPSEYQPTALPRRETGEQEQAVTTEIQQKPKEQEANKGPEPSYIEGPMSHGVQDLTDATAQPATLSDDPRELSELADEAKLASPPQGEGPNVETAPNTPETDPDLPGVMEALATVQLDPSTKSDPDYEFL